MSECKKKAAQNRGICSDCGKVVPAHHDTRGSEVLLIKECPDCGPTEALVSSDAERYHQKRKLVNYEGGAKRSCSLHCQQCKIHKDPTLVFVDITNRCNMNCPICLANIPAMGFRFDPPMAYFDKIFQRLSEIDPKPKIQIFGGEPTVRKDLPEIIRHAREKYGLQARVVTNGLKLADEKYCKELIDTDTELMFSFDGRDPKIYEAMRRHPEAYNKKMKALENISKHRKSKVTIMCCVGEDVNDAYMADTVDFCYESRSFIAALDLIPLTAEWGPEEVDVKSATIEGVETIMKKAIPGMEFFPAGMLYMLNTLRATFNLGRMTFGGAHPNCEAVSAMIADDTGYHPASKYLTRPLEEVLSEMVELDKEMGKRLETSLIARLFGRKGRQFVFGKAILGLVRRSVNTKEVFGGSATAAFTRIIWGLICGKQMKVVLRANTKCHGILRVIILPFEDKECIESARLVDCPAAFAYEHIESGDIRLMPVCAWPAYKNDVLRATSEKYGVDHSGGKAGLGALTAEPETEG